MGDLKIVPPNKKKNNAFLSLIWAAPQIKNTTGKKLLLIVRHQPRRYVFREKTHEIKKGFKNKTSCHKAKGSECSF